MRNGERRTGGSHARFGYLRPLSGGAFRGVRGSGYDRSPRAIGSVRTTIGLTIATLLLFALGIAVRFARSARALDFVDYARIADRAGLHAWAGTRLLVAAGARKPDRKPDRPDLDSHYSFGD